MDRDSVKVATDEVLANALAFNSSASIDGVIVQHMAKPTTELVWNPPRSCVRPSSDGRAGRYLH